MAQRFTEHSRRSIAPFACMKKTTWVGESDEVTGDRVVELWPMRRRPLARRRLIGHGGRDVVELHELADVQTFLETDAQELREFLESSHGFSHDGKQSGPNPLRDGAAYHAVSHSVTSLCAL